MRLMPDLTRPPVTIEIEHGATPLEFLRSVYCNEAVPLGIRLRAAIEAAPYVHPKLSAIANVTLGGDFAERLEKAIERTHAVRVIEHSDEFRRS